MDWHLRPASGEDREFIWAVHRATMGEYVVATWGRWDDAWQRDRFAAQFDPARVKIIVADGRDAGVLALEERPGELYVASIQLSPEHQGRGIGTAVIREVLLRAAQTGRAVSLQVLRSNPRARELYERIGFRLAGETVTHHLMRAHPAAAGSTREGR